MKTLRNGIITACLTLMLSVLVPAMGWTQAPPSKGQTITVSVQGMVCNFCAVGIEKSLRKVNGVDDIYINLDRHLVAVTTKPGANVSPEKISETIKNAGYKVVKVETTSKNLEEVKKETAK